MARWKLGPQGAYFDPNDTGPNQVDPPPSAQGQPSGTTQTSGSSDPWADFNKQWQQDSEKNPWAHDWNWRMGTLEYQAQHPEGPGSIFGSQPTGNAGMPSTQMPAGDMSKGGIWNWLQGNAPGFGDQHVMGDSGGPFTALTGGIQGSGMVSTLANRSLQQPGKIDSLNNQYQQRAGLLQGIADSGYTPSGNGAFSSLMSRALAPFGVKR